MCISFTPIDRFWALFLGIWLCSLWLNFTVKGQHRPDKFEYISIEQGLSQSSINCVTQDEFGFIWLGTQDGLNRYNGYTFLILKNDPHDSTTISNNFIHSIYSDRRGSLWVGTDNGLNRLDLRTGKIRRYPVNERVLFICGDSNSVWIGTAGFGCQEINLMDNPAAPFSKNLGNSTELSNKDIKTLLKDHRGRLWIGTSVGLYRHFISEKTLDSAFSLSIHPFALNRLRINCLFEDSQRRIWIGTERGIVIDGDPTGVIREINLPDGLPVSINGIAEDISGAIWAASDDGLFIIDGDLNNIRHISYNPNRLSSINSGFLSASFRSSDGTMWVGSYNQGLNKYSPYKDKFDHFWHTHNGNSLSNNDVWAFCEDENGNIWIGTDKGLNRFRKINKNVTLIDRFFNDPADNGSLANDRIWSLMTDKKGNIWIGTDAGLCKLSKDQTSALRSRFKTYSHVPGQRNSIINNRVTVIKEDHRGQLWIGTSGGLSVFDPEREQFTSFRNIPGDSTSLSHNRILSLCEDRNGVMWIGTSGGGLNRFDETSSKFMCYRHDPHNDSSISNDRVTSIYQDSAGNIWMGTLGGGLNRFDEGKKSFTCYTEKDGLSNNAVYGILEDRERNLWLSTNKGISKFIRSTTVQRHDQDPPEYFRNYSANDGLQSSEFNSGSYFQSSSGHFYFGGINGFNVFDPLKIHDNSNVPPIVFTSIRKLSKNAVPMNFIYENEPIELSYQDQGIAFAFASMDYSASEMNQFAYRMVGFDKDWNYSGTKHDITYTNLDPGEYVFMVKGTNYDQVWNETGISISIIVHPPFWNHWWFKAAIVIGFVWALYASYKYRTRKIQRKNRELETLVAERTLNLEKANMELQIANRKIVQANEMKSRFLANMSHELRTPLNSIIGFSDLLSQGVLGRVSPEQEESIQSISLSSKSLLKLINDVLDLSKIEAGKMTLKLSPVHLDELIHNAWHMMVPLFEKKKQNFSIQLPDPCPLIPIDENKMKQVIINLLGNASKFTAENGSIRLTAQPISFNGTIRDYIEIRITDTGKGIPPEELESIFEEFKQASDNTENQGTGLGLALSKRIVELHGGRIWAESDGRSGSEFIVHLPMKELSSS